MADLKNPKLMYLKGWLLLAILISSVALTLIECPSWKVVGLLILVAWSSARFYYFMFYVIEKYVDPSYRFAGIGSFVGYLVRQRRGGVSDAGAERETDAGAKGE